MAKLIRIYWRDIPSQVIVKVGRKSAKVMLPDAFQVAIDRAAMRAGKGTSDAYMEDWVRKQTNVEGDLEDAAKEAAAALEAEFPPARLEALTKAKGWLENLPDNSPDEQP